MDFRDCFDGAKIFNILICHHFLNYNRNINYNFVKQIRYIETNFLQNLETFWKPFFGRISRNVSEGIVCVKWKRMV